jgi:hypothetical protein
VDHSQARIAPLVVESTGLVEITQPAPAAPAATVAAPEVPSCISLQGAAPEIAALRSIPWLPLKRAAGKYDLKSGGQRAVPDEAAERRDYERLRRLVVANVIEGRRIGGRVFVSEPNLLKHLYFTRGWQAVDQKDSSDTNTMEHSMPSSADYRRAGDNCLIAASTVDDEIERQALLALVDQYQSLARHKATIEHQGALYRARRAVGRQRD